MQVVVNGSVRQIQDAATAAELLVELKILPNGVAVIRNDEALGHADFAGAVLHEGDRIEIVRVVGGG